MATRITSKGQITIPAAIRAAAHIKPGTELEWAYDPVGERIVATRFSRRKRDKPTRFDALIGSATVKMSTEEILALTRGDPEA
jgi:AbrB family looped-hinge helix DNA binding protein